VDPDADPDGLSDREIDVLRLIALGYTNSEIAERLLLSVRTVESHRAHVQRKLGLSKRSQLVRYALERRMLDSEPA
jgi:two-component system response regulator NreC